MPETRDEEIKRIVENRRRNAEIRRAQQIKKRNMTIAGIATIVIILIIIIVISVSCSSKKDKGNVETTTQIETTTEAVTEVTTEVETTAEVETTVKPAKKKDETTTTAPKETTKKSDDSENDKPTSVKYTNDGVNLRSEPSSDSDDSIIGQIEKGEKVEVVSEDSEEIGWTKVRYDGQTGYVSSRFLSNQNVYDQ